MNPLTTAIKRRAGLSFALLTDAYTRRILKYLLCAAGEFCRVFSA
jgi:hypothetical protein